MNTLLERIRSINKLLQKSVGNPIDLEEMAQLLRDQIKANCYVLGKYGQILGYAFVEGFACDVMESIVLNEESFPDDYNEGLLYVSKTRSEAGRLASHCMFRPEEKCVFANKVTTIIPVIGGGQRLGTLLLSKFNSRLSDEDLILGEYGATVVGMEMLRSKAESIEEEARKRAAVHIALETLSYSELEAVDHIFNELEGEEGVLVASKIADKTGITRSVIVNALRKIESANVIEARSLGMKGTYIRVLNQNLLDELQELKRK